MSKHQLYDVVLRTSSHDLGVILQAIEGNAVLVAVHPVRDANAPKGAPTTTNTGAPKKSRFINGRRLKGISGIDLVLKTIRDAGTHGASRFDIGLAFKAMGFAETSHSAALTRLTQMGKVKHIGGGMYGLVSPDAPLHMGAATPRHMVPV